MTAVFKAKGTGAAVGASLRVPRLKVKWQRSVGAGTLVVQGSTTLAARARVDMRRPGGGPLATLQLPVPGGGFRQTLPLRQGALSGGAKVFPGGFVVALTGRCAIKRFALDGYLKVLDPGGCSVVSQCCGLNPRHSTASVSSVSAVNGFSTLSVSPRTLWRRRSN